VTKKSDISKLQNYKNKLSQKRWATKCPPHPDCAIQTSDAVHSDINIIAAEYGRGRLIRDAAQGNAGRFGATPDIMSLQHAINLTREADANFMALPAVIRSRFNNDPVKMVAFMGDPKNFEEAKRLGLLTERPGQDDQAADKRERVRVDSNTSNTSGTKSEHSSRARDTTRARVPAPAPVPVPSSSKASSDDVD